jgi:hypothetical protein
MSVSIVLATACATSSSESRVGGSGSGRPNAAPALVLVGTWGAGGGAAEDRWWIAGPSEAAMAPNGQWVVVSGETETVVFSVPSGARLAAFRPGTAQISAIAVSPDSRRFAIADRSRHCVAVWTIDPLREETCLGSDATVAEPRIAFSPDGTELATVDKDWLARWSLTANAPIWRTKLVAPSSLFLKWLAWPTPGTILVEGDHGEFQGYDANTHQLRWQQQGAACYLGSVGNDAILGGDFREGNVSGVLARLDLTSGRLRDLTGGDDIGMFCGAMLDDDTAVLVEPVGIAHRYRIGGAELGSFALSAHGLPTITTGRNGRVAAVVASNYIALWNLSTGTPIGVPGVQQGRILALDADQGAVVSAAADGTVAVRRPNGSVVTQHRTRGTGCVAWAVDAPSRRAVCAVEIGDYAQPPTHEWFDLESGRARVADWNRSRVVAIDGHGTTWSVATEYANNHAAWIEAAAQGTEEIQVREPSLVRIDQLPSIARIVDRGRAVAFGSATEDGLWLMNRRGAITKISGARVLDLAADRAGDRLAIVTLSGIELWHRVGPSAWKLRWSNHESYPDVARAFGLAGYSKPTAVVALSHDGSLLAATDGEKAHTIAVYDTVTGARIAALTVGDQDRFVTALAIGSAGAIYAGTNTGRVLALSLRR